MSAPIHPSLDTRRAMHRTPRRRRRLIRSLTGVVALAIAATACGSDPTSEGVARVVDATTASTAAPFVAVPSTQATFDTGGVPPAAPPPPAPTVDKAAPTTTTALAPAPPSTPPPTLPPSAIGDEAASAAPAPDAPVTTTPPTTVEPQPHELQPPVAAPVPCEASDASPGWVSGVADFLNHRADPSLGADVIATIPAGAAVTYFESTLVHHVDRSWIQVMAEVQCGWVAADHVTDSSGRRTVTMSSMRSYVSRGLRGLDAELQHADMVLVGPEQMAPFDPTELESALADLRAIGVAYPGVSVEPDPAVQTSEGQEAGCFFSHSLSCQFLLIDGDSVVGRVSVGWAGDGITDLSLQWT